MITVMGDVAECSHKSYSIMPLSSMDGRNVSIDHMSLYSLWVEEENGL